MELLLVVVLASAFTTLTAVVSPIDFKCATLHCAKFYTECFSEKVCRQNMGCAAKCWEGWDEDHTPQKDAIQNCTASCTFSYEDDVYDHMMHCLEQNNCLKFPPIPSICKAPSGIKIKKNITVSDIQGNWWVLRGHNRVYDCFPCQRNYFTSGSPHWTYRADYQAYLTNGTLKVISQSGPVFSDPAILGFNLSYEDAGLTNNESWWIFDQIDDATSGDSYFLIYYCGNVLQWNFEGSIIYSKGTSLADSAIPAISNSFKENVGLDFSTFCSPEAAECPDMNWSFCCSCSYCSCVVLIFCLSCLLYPCYCDHLY